MIPAAKRKVIICKYCGTNPVVKVGKYKNAQLYFCNSCQRKFKAGNNIFHMKYPEEYVNSALKLRLSGMSYRDIRNYFIADYNFYPSKSTLCRWIKKYNDFNRTEETSILMIGYNHS